jgi:hypothetical protein
VTSEDVPPLGVFLRPALPAAALHGLPGEAAVALAAATGADEAAILVAFLAMLGCAAGRQPHLVYRGAEHPARLFTVIVGDTATGLKGTAVGANECLFVIADPDWGEARILRGLQSPEAMIERVADDTSADGRLLILESEFARLAERMARSGTFSPQLRAAWDGTILERVTRDPHRSQRASNAHIALIGQITPGELMKHHRRLSQDGGLENRCLFVISAPSHYVSPFTTADTSDLAARLRYALDTSRKTVLERADPISRILMAERGLQPSAALPLAADVQQGWPDWQARIKAQIPRAADELGPLWSRGEAQVLRLGVAYAVADCSPVVTATHISAAVGAWTFCAKSAERLFGVPHGLAEARINPRHVAKIVRSLHQNYPGWLPRNTIGKDVLGGNAGDVSAIMDDLVAQELVERRVIKTAGRDRVEYRLLPPRPA